MKKIKFQSGAQTRKLDLRDIHLGKIQLPVLLPASHVANIAGITRVWQGAFPACGSHSGAHLLAILKFIQTTVKQYLSPHYLWDKIKLIDGYPLESGTDLRSILKTLQNWGACDYNLLPNDYTQTLQQYSDASVITDEMAQNGQTRVILPNYGFIDNPTVDELKQAIFQNNAVIVLIRCDGGFFGTSTPSFTKETYGHFIVAYGFDDAEQIFYTIDSAEKDNTLALKKINYKYISFIKEVGTCVEAPVGYVDGLKKQVQLLQTLLQLWQKLTALLKK